MKKLFSSVNEKWKEYALAGSVCVVLLVLLLNIGNIFFGIGKFLGALSPVFLGIIIAYILNSSAVFLRRKVFGKMKKEKLAWMFSVVLCYVLVLGFLVLIVSMLIPQVAGNIQVLLDNAEIYLDNLVAKYENRSYISGVIADNINEYLIGENGIVERAAQFITDNIRSLLNTVSNFGGRAVNLAVGAILSLYFLLAKSGIIGTFSKFFSLSLSPLKYMRGKIFFEKFNAIFSKYIACELLDAIIVGLVNFLFMIICGMPNALFISVIAAVTNLVPTFGPVVGAVINCFILLLSVPSKVVLFLIFTFALQTVDGYIVKPRLFGGVLNVPGVLILLSIIAFGEIMGVTGMLLAIPFAALIVYFYSELLIPWMELRRDLKNQ